MKKTPDVSKYDPDWQIIRIKVKNPMIPLDDKIKVVNSYFNRTQTIDAWSRVTKWLRGILTAFRAAGDIPSLERTTLEIARYNGIKPSAKEPLLPDDQVLEKLKMYPYNERIQLWKDLFERNKRWLIKGYYDIDHNNFMNILAKTFEINHEHIPLQYSLEKLTDLRNNSEKPENPHKFFS